MSQAGTAVFHYERFSVYLLTLYMQYFEKRWTDTLCRASRFCQCSMRSNAHPLRGSTVFGSGLWDRSAIQSIVFLLLIKASSGFSFKHLQCRIFFSSDFSRRGCFFFFFILFFFLFQKEKLVRAAEFGLFYCLPFCGSRSTAIASCGH